MSLKCFNWVYKLATEHVFYFRKAASCVNSGWSLVSGSLLFALQLVRKGWGDKAIGNLDPKASIPGNFVEKSHKSKSSYLVVQQATKRGRDRYSGKQHMYVALNRRSKLASANLFPFWPFISYLNATGGARFHCLQ